MNLAKALTISAPVLEEIFQAARRANRHECMGLLATDSAKTGRDTISAGCLLSSEASYAHAQADPQSLCRAAQVFRGQGLAPVGIWHSHGAMAAYHSSTDDRTVLDFLPAMMEWNLVRAGHAFKAPLVPTKDEAALPLDDGRWLKLTLLGPKVPGQDAHERVEWSSISISFDSFKHKPQSILHDSCVELVADGVRLTLGIPEGSQIHALTEERQPLRIAQLYSLVVNRRGDRYAEMLTVFEVENESRISKHECDIEVIEAQPPESLSKVHLLEI